MTEIDTRRPPAVQARGWTVALALTAATLAMVVAGVPSGARLAYPVGAIAGALWLLKARGDAAYLECTLVLWLTMPFVRRVVDHVAGFQELSPIMVGAPLASMVGLVFALRRPGPARPAAVAAFTVAFAALGLAAMVGTVVRGPIASVGALTTWLGPVALGAFVLTSRLEERALDATLVRVAAVAVPLLGAYGVLQWLVVPPWDASWLAAVDAGSFGVGEAMEVRVFSTLNAPGPFAMVLTFLLVVLLPVRLGGLARVTVLLGYAALGLSLVRSAWIAWGVAVIALLLAGRARAVGRVAAGAAVAALAIAAELPGAALVTERLESLADPAGDFSLGERLELQRALLPQALSRPLGDGLGATGSASRLEGDGQLGALSAVDSGYVEWLYVLGPIVGVVFLLVLVGAAIILYHQHRLGGVVRVGAAAYLLTLPASLYFGNSLAEVTGLTYWVCLGLLGRPPVASPMAATRHPSRQPAPEDGAHE